MAAVDNNNTFSYGTVPPVTIQNITLGGFALATFIIGTPGSIMSFCYFTLRCTKSSSTIQYMIINMVDAITTILLLSNGLAEIQATPGVFASKGYCNMWGYLWQVSTRMSVYLVAVLSVSRCASLYNPLRRSSTRSVIIPIVVYFLILLVQQSLPIIMGKGFWYADRMSMCVWLITDIIEDYKSLEFKTLHFAFMFLEFVIPFFPVVISCAISIHVLQRRKINGPINAVRNHKSHATVTIIYLTIAYVLFNTPVILYIMLETVYLWRNIDGPINELVGISTSVYSFISAFTNNQMVTLNASVNVLIYFCRNQELRAFWILVIQCRTHALQKRTGSMYKPPANRSFTRHSVRYSRCEASRSPECALANGKTQRSETVGVTVVTSTE